MHLLRDVLLRMSLNFLSAALPGFHGQVTFLPKAGLLFALFRLRCSRCVRHHVVGACKELLVQFVTLVQIAKPLLLIFFWQGQVVYYFVSPRLLILLEVEELERMTLSIRVFVLCRSLFHLPQELVSAGVLL